MLHVLSSGTFLIAMMVLGSLSPSSSYAMTETSPRSSNFTHNSAVENKNEFKSFREWKSSRLSEIEFKIRLIKEKIGSRRSFAADPNLLKKEGSEAGLNAGLQSQLEREQLNLAITSDLSISDYFVGYLTKQQSLDKAIKDVSGRLSAEEVAELMSAYAQHFFQTRPSSIRSSPRADSGL